MPAPALFRHASGDDKDGCISCWLEYDSEPVWGIPEGRACQEPQDDGEGYCAICGHTVEVRS